MTFKRFKKAFTLIELVIAVAVMGTIASFSTASYVGYKDMADTEQAKLDVQQVKNAVDNYYSSNYRYPTLPLSKQPSPDVTVGGKTIKMYSKVDVDTLVKERYLQSVPALKKGQYFAVNYNGVVTIEEGYSESVVVEDGNIIVEKKENNNIKFQIYTGPSISSIKIKETDKNYSTTKKEVEFKGASGVSVTKAEEYDLYTGYFNVSDSEGQKYFAVTLRYTDGTTKTLNATIQYALNADSISDDPYWYKAGIDQSTDAGKRTNVDLVTSSDATKNSQISLNWTNQELISGASAIQYEIIKEYRNTNSTSDADWKEAPDSPIVHGNTSYVDTAVRSDKQYRYKIYAYTYGKNTDGTNKKTLNCLITKSLTPSAYNDTKSYIENITKNDFNTAYNKDISVRAGDVDGGIMRVSLIVARVEKGVIVEKFKEYEMNKTVDGTSTIIDKTNNVKVTTDVYTVPIEIKDDYMIYYIKVIDNKGYETYCYMDPTLTKKKDATGKDLESDTDFEARRQKVEKTIPANIEDYCYTLLRGLVEIHNDTFVDESKIDVQNSNYHLYDGKITLP